MQKYCYISFHVRSACELTDEQQHKYRMPISAAHIYCSNALCSKQIRICSQKNEKNGIFLSVFLFLLLDWNGISRKIFISVSWVKFIINFNLIGGKWSYENALHLNARWKWETNVVEFINIGNMFFLMFVAIKSLCCWLDGKKNSYRVEKGLI